MNYIFLVLLHYLVLLCCDISSQFNSFKINDHISLGDKELLKKIASGTVAETKLITKRALFIAAKRVSDDDLHYGIVIAHIREYYKNMLDIYRSALRNLIGADLSLDRLILPPMYGTIRPVHYLLYMNRVRDYENKIIGAVEAIQNMPKNAVSLDPALKDANETSSSTSEQLRMQEATLKSLLRQQHLMKRLGLSENTSTSSKRFIAKWPVQDTWDLDKTY